MLQPHVSCYIHVLACGGVRSSSTCCEQTPAAADSGAQWRCEPAASANACRVAARARAAPGATHPRPPGTPAAPWAPPPPGPPAGLGGRLQGEDKRQQKSSISLTGKPAHIIPLIRPLGWNPPNIFSLCTVFHVAVTGGEARWGGEAFLTAEQLMWLVSICIHHHLWG